MAAPNLLFITNKRSGTSSYTTFDALVQQVCADANASYSIAYTKAPRHATELAQDGIEKGFSCIVAVGGDGTVNEVASALKGSPVPMAIVPAGSGNGLARHLGIPLDHKEAMRVIFESEPRSIDTFTINGRLSLNVSGIGFDAHVATEFGKDGRRGLASYARIALREYRQFKTFQATLNLDGGLPVVLDAFVIALANSAQYGNNARIAPQSSVCDGKLNFVVIKKMPPTRLDLVYALFRGDITRSASCKTYEAGKATIQLSRAIPYHVDGEPCAATDTFSVQVHPSSLSVMVPAYRKSSI